MKAILTVVGKDKIGIISGVSSKVTDLNINILDVSQTIMEEYFTMTMMLDLQNCNKSFDVVKKEISEKGLELGVDAKIQNEQIFNSMHAL